MSYLDSLTGTEMDWAYRTVPQADSNNLQKAWPRGKGLGGSGAINGMYWNRGNRENYEAWKSESTVCIPSHTVLYVDYP